jgi:hypothetical protein
MLTIHKLIHLSSKWEVIFSNRPSTLRNSFIYWLLRILFNIVILLAITLLITTFSRELWLPALEELVTHEDYEVIDKLLLGFRTIAIFFIIISGIIVWLSKGALRRNTYINQVEELLDEYKDVSADEYKANPNNTSIK